MEESKWKNKNLNIGILRENEKISFTYFSKEPVEIERISPGCGGCTNITGYDNNKIDVEFKADEIPIHFLQQNLFQQNVRKNITVYYKNGESETLYFTAIVMK